MPNPRSLVGKLLVRIKGAETRTPQSTTPPKGPADRDRAMLLYTRLRDAGLVATRQQLVLDGELEARRKEIVAALEADRYDEAENLLDGLDTDLQDEVQAQARAVQRLKDELAPVRKRAATHTQALSTSPSVARLVQAMNGIAAQLEDHLKAKAVLAAVGRLDALAAHVNAIDKQLIKDQEAFDKAYQQLQDAVAALPSPVVAPEVQGIRSKELVQARQKADAGDAYGGLVLAVAGVKACATAAQLLRDFEQALIQAKNTLRTLLGDIFPLDTQRIHNDFIEAARQKAVAGQRQAALDLLAQVPAQCAQAKRVKDQSPFGAIHTTEIANDMETLLRHPQRAALKAEVEALNQRYTRAKANQGAALGKATTALFSEIYWECKRLTGLLDQCARYVARRDTVVKPLVAALRTDGLPATVQATTSEIGRVEEQLAKADRQAAKHLYELAGDTLGEAQQACARVAQLKQDQGRYATIRQEVADLLQALPDLTGTSLQAAVSKLGARLTQATELAQVQRQFAAAAQALDTLKPEVQAAAQWGAGHGEALAASRQALTGGAAASLDKVRALLDQLKAHEGHPGAKAQITEMERLLKQAATLPEKEASIALADAGQRYVVGLQHAQQHARFEQRVKGTVNPAKLDLDTNLPIVATLVQRIDEQIDAGRQSSLAQDHAQADQRLEGALALVAQARQLAADSERCDTRLTDLKTLVVPGLTTHAPPEADAVIGKDIKAINQALVLVERQIKSRDFEGALKALDRLESACHKATLKKKVSAGQLTAVEMDDQCKQLAARPNGQAALDELVESFKSSQAIDAVLAAMKARFKLDDAQCLRATGDDAGKVTQELCALYTTMTKVPPKHTRDNPSFKKIVRTAKLGSSYGGGEKVINMGEGHPDTSSEYRVGNTNQLPDVDEDSKPNPGAAPVKYFDWNTWHEVGHAMDDRKQFMNKRSGMAAFGGWQKHGGDLLAVAEAVAAELATPGITAQAVARYLDAGVSPSPQPAGWSKVANWVVAAGHASDPWDAGAKCATSIKSGGLQAGGRIYHEAYQGDWYSYLPAARSHGITGYQFRAPGEWFSELYAAFKSGKLKPSHPAQTWLQELFAD